MSGTCQTSLITVQLELQSPDRYVKPEAPAAGRARGGGLLQEQPRCGAS